MSTTLKILDHKVGEGGLTHDLEVKRVQQLLKLNGYHLHCNGTWGQQTHDALLAFQEQLLRQDSFDAVEAGVATPVRPFLLPSDSALFELAYRGGVLIRLAPGRRGEFAFHDVHDWCVKHKTRFDMIMSRAVWGLEGYIQWAVVTKISPGDHGPSFDTSQPLALNCSLYANLMMAVWARGNLHGPPFHPGISQAGYAHLAVTRYHYPAAVECDGADSIQAHTRHHSDRLYCLEGGHHIGHMALLLGGAVHECNMHEVGGSYVASLSLDLWCARHSGPTWVSGPSPFA